MGTPVPQSNWPISEVLITLGKSVAEGYGTNWYTHALQGPFEAQDQCVCVCVLCVVCVCYVCVFVLCVYVVCVCMCVCVCVLCMRVQVASVIVKCSALPCSCGRCVLINEWKGECKECCPTWLRNAYKIWGCRVAKGMQTGRQAETETQDKNTHR